MTDFASSLLYAVYLLPLMAASAVAVPVALRARNANAASLCAFFLTVAVSAFSGAVMGLMLGMFGTHQTAWYIPSGATPQQYGIFGALLFGIIEGGLGVVLGCVLAMVCGAIVSGRLRNVAP